VDPLTLSKDGETLFFGAMNLNRAVDTRRRAYRIYGVTVFGVLLRLSGDRQGIWGV
jgi:hypothetical protein